MGTTLQAAQTQRPASLTSQLTASTKAGGGSLPSGTTTTAAAAARVLAALNGDMAQRLEAIEARCAHIEAALSTCASCLPLHAHRCCPKLTPRCPVRWCVHAPRLHTVTARDQADAVSRESQTRVLAALQEAVLLLTQQRGALGAPDARGGPPSGGQRSAMCGDDDGGGEQLTAKRSRQHHHRRGLPASRHGDPGAEEEVSCVSHSGGDAGHVTAVVTGTASATTTRVPVWAALAQEEAEDVDPFACLQEHGDEAVAPPQAEPEAACAKQHGALPILLPPRGTPGSYDGAQSGHQMRLNDGTWRSVRRPSNK